MHDLCRLLNIQYPIVQGGMGNISNATLAAAVSEAGGLGTIGCGTMSPDEVENIIMQTKELTDQPFAVNIALQVTSDLEEIIEMVIRHDVPIVSLSAGNPAPWIPVFHEHDIRVLSVVASVKHAQKAEKSGADVIVAEGFEAAGISSEHELTTFTLIPQITAAVDQPVLAAGGIGDGRVLAAALALGASGVQLGTRLIATKEAPFQPHYKDLLLQANGYETLVIGRSVGQTRRILSTPYGQKLASLEKDGMTLEQYHSLTTEEIHMKGALEGDFENGFLNGGQVAGLIDDLPTVKDLFAQMIHEANEQTKQMKSVLQTLSAVQS